MIDLDANATTPLDPRVREAMLPWLDAANPSSVHLAGQRARAAIDAAREQVAAALGAEPKELTFTSGGTEADNLALRGAWLSGREKGRTRIVVSAVEHPAVLDTAAALGRMGAQVVVVGVDGEGRLDLAAFEDALGDDVCVASVMWANNETGVISPLHAVAALCQSRGVPLHVDAVQAFGKVPVAVRALPVDMLSVSAHKIHGPMGAGALWVRRGAAVAPAQTGGHQERGRRGGTENVAALVGFGAAATLVSSGQDLRPLRDRLERALLALPGARANGAGAERVGNTTSVSFEGLEGEALLMALDLAEIAASSGSACSSGSLEPSHVLLAMGLQRAWARGAVRFSLSRMTSEGEIDEAIARIPRIVEQLRRRA